MRKPSSPAISIRSAVSARILANSRFSTLQFNRRAFEKITGLPEIHAIPLDGNAFRPKPQFLLQAVLAGEKNPAARAQNPVPRNRSAAGTKRPHHLARGAGMTACG